MKNATTSSAEKQWKIDQYLNNDDRILFRVIWNDGETSDKMMPQGFVTREEAEEFAQIVDDSVPQELSPGPWIIEETPMQFVIKAPKNEEDYLRKVVAVTAGLQSNNQQNARLIATAPELLGTCKMLLKALVQDCDAEAFSSEISQAEGVIAKAEGSLPEQNHEQAD